MTVFALGDISMCCNSWYSITFTSHRANLEPVTYILAFILPTLYPEAIAEESYPPRPPHFTKMAAKRNTADVTGSKPIAVRLQPKLQLLLVV
jgi:hypothetical protein